MIPPATTPDFLARLALWAQQYPAGETVFTAALFVLLLGVLIFAHELGHYAAARQVGIRVLTFSIGFGRALFSWHDRHGTEWKIGWLPLGGYVQMLGQEDLKASTPSDEAGHYLNKTLLQRAWVIAAGPLANVVLGVVVLWGAFMLGEQRLRAEVGAVLPNMPASGVLQPGDRMLAFNGQPVADWQALLDRVSESGGMQLNLTIERAGQTQIIPITPQLQEHTDIFGETHTVGRLGVTPSGAVEVVARGPLEALERAFERTAELTGLTLKSLWMLLTGAIGTENLTGPLGIANITGQTAQSGFYALLLLTALISINLCIVNLLPLPILDGGHLVFLALEKLRGKPLGERTQEWAFRFGLVCVIGLALLSTFHDIQRLSGRTPVPGAAAQDSTPAQP